MKHIIITLLIVFLISCSKKPVLAGIIFLSQGDVSYTLDGKIYPAVENAEIFWGEKVVTGTDGACVISLAGEGGTAEVQNSSEFFFSNTSALIKNFNISKGNVWLKIKKISKDSRVNLYSPAAIAGVRGTQFFTFKSGDLDGICMCNGSVDYQTHNAVVSTNLQQDTIILTKDSKSIVLTSADLSFLADSAHNHSTFLNSPLGKRPTMSAEQGKKMDALVSARRQAAGF